MGAANYVVGDDLRLESDDAGTRRVDAHSPRLGMNEPPAVRYDSSRRALGRGATGWRRSAYGRCSVRRSTGTALRHDSVANCARKFRARTRPLRPAVVKATQPSPLVQSRFCCCLALPENIILLRPLGVKLTFGLNCSVNLVAGDRRLPEGL